MNPAQDLPLRDIHLPESISWWPLASGWWVLLAIVLIAILAGLYWRYFRTTKPHRIAYKKIAQQQLQTIIQNHADANASQTLAELSRLLRRTALSYYRREKVASLTGTDWMNALNALSSIACFTEQHAKLFSQNRYQANTEANLQELFDCCQKWLEHLPEFVEKNESLTETHSNREVSA